MKAIEDFSFDEKDIAFMKEQDFDADFIDYLESFQFTGNIYASREGDLVFPNRPIISVEAPIIEAQIMETLVLNILNYQSLIATKGKPYEVGCG